jgi:hypothetical protein
MSLEEVTALKASLQQSWHFSWFLSAVGVLLIGGLFFQFKRNRSLQKKRTKDFRKSLEKKELALLRKEIQHYLTILRALQDQNIPLQNFLPDLNYWEDFRHKFDNIHAHFFSKTKSNHPDLTHQDILWLALLKLKFSESEIQLLFGPENVDWPEHLSRKLGGQSGVKLPQLVERL